MICTQALAVVAPNNTSNPTTTTTTTITSSVPIAVPAASAPIITGLSTVSSSASSSSCCSSYEAPTLLSTITSASVRVSSASQEQLIKRATTLSSSHININNYNSNTNNNNSRPPACDMRSIDYDTILHPLDHQVGGHTQLMLLDQFTVCKPLIQRELLFYLNIPRDLRPFVPSYKGVVQVRRTDHQSNNISTIFHPIRGSISDSSLSRRHEINPNAKSSHVKSSTASTCMGQKELRVQLSTCNDQRLLLNQELVWDHNNHQSSNKSHHHVLEQTNSSPATTTTTATSSTTTTTTTGSNNTLSSCNEDWEFSSRPTQRYFLLLENIASHYHIPCILDLKMGTRQHGDDASAEKRKRQMAKCASTTSAVLGVRLCGMQVFREDWSDYCWKDKYYGRRLDVDGLRKALRDFFHTGLVLKVSAIESVLKQLTCLMDAVEKQTSFRFYSTSLLIAYEGCINHHHHHFQNSSPDVLLDSAKMNETEVKMIDFAHSIVANTRNVLTTSTAGNVKSCPQPRDLLSQQQRHQGPDQGFLKGLNSLIKLLREILEMERNAKQNLN